MLWIIPAMILFMIGDYCMGIEPKDSTAIAGPIGGCMIFTYFHLACGTLIL